MFPYLPFAVSRVKKVKYPLYLIMHYVMKVQAIVDV
jgi:hypothetical protein